jgi:hypothetical protein
MAEKQPGKVLRTLQDIESLFETGGEITPFLEELFRFLNDLMPLLARARCYLQSTATSAPAASDNIHSAEQMAEDATNTIMDNADQICVQLGDLQAGDGNGDTKKVLEEVVHRAQQIQMSLQFQDITSQHLQQATRIVEAIHTKLDQMFLGLEEMGQQNELVQRLVEKYAHVEDCDELLETEDTIHRDGAISQADIDALFGAS